MLEGQYGGRHEYCDLFVVAGGFECRTYGNFSFSVSDIATYKSVHDSCAFHIRLSISYGIKLVISLLIWEHFFKFFLPYSVRSKCITLLVLSYWIKFHKILCYLLNSSVNLCFGLIPLDTSKFIQLRLLFRVWCSIFLKPVKLCGKNIQIAVPGVLYLDIIFFNALNSNLFNSLVYTKSVHFMDNIITDIKFVKSGNWPALVFLLLLLSCTARKYIIFSNDYKTNKRIFKATMDISIRNHNSSRHYFFVIILTEIALRAQLL